MRKTIVIALLLFTISSMLVAATVASDSAAGPALVRNPVERQDDSPLVKAAKRSLAARMKNIAAGVVINDQFLRTTSGGHFAEASGTMAPAAANAKPQSSTFMAAPTVAPKNPRPTLEREQKDLKASARAYAYDAEQGPYGEMEEDVTIRSQEMTRQQQQDVQQQLDRLPRPSRPPQ